MNYRPQTTAKPLGRTTSCPPVAYLPHTHCETIREWALGKPVQYLSKRRQYWVCTTSPSWREDTQYRVKPDELNDETCVIL